MFLTKLVVIIIIISFSHYTHVSAVLSITFLNHSQNLVFLVQKLESFNNVKS